MARNLISKLSLEDENSSNIQPVDEVALAETQQECDNCVNDISSTVDDMEEAQELQSVLEDKDADLAAAQQEGATEMDQAVAIAAANEALSLVKARLGIQDSGYIVSYESYKDGGSSLDNAISLSREGIKEVIDKIIESVKKAVNWIIEKITSFFSMFYNFIKNLFSRKKKVVDDFKAAEERRDNINKENKEEVYPDEYVNVAASPVIDKEGVQDTNITSTITISKGLVESINNKVINNIRLSIGVALQFDKNLHRNYFGIIKYMESKGIRLEDLYEEHDGRDIDLPPTEDNAVELIGQCSTNFSKERFEKILEMYKIVYADEQKPLTKPIHVQTGPKTTILTIEGRESTSEKQFGNIVSLIEYVKTSKRLYFNEYGLNIIKTLVTIGSNKIEEAIKKANTFEEFIILSAIEVDRSLKEIESLTHAHDKIVNTIRDILNSNTSDDVQSKALNIKDQIKEYLNVMSFYQIDNINITPEGIVSFQKRKKELSNSKFIAIVETEPEEINIKFNGTKLSNAKKVIEDYEKLLASCNTLKNLSKLDKTAKDLQKEIKTIETKLKTFAIKDDPYLAGFAKVYSTLTNIIIKRVTHLIAAGQAILGFAGKYHI